MIFTLGAMVIMGMMGGGMIALSLASPRQLQNIFGILALAGGALGLIAAVVNSFELPSMFPGLINNLLSLIIAGFIGYAVTTFFVLTYNATPDFEAPDPRTARETATNKPAVIYFAPGEPPQYDARVAARSFETHDYPRTLPPTLLRPLYLHDLKQRYAAIITSPYRAIQMKLAQKVDDRLGKRYRSYIAFYDDEPTLQEVAVQAIREGSNKLIVLHARLTSPPPQLKAREILAELRPERYGLSIIETQPLWDSELLPRVFVRRALGAVDETQRGEVGLLLVGQGHPRGRHASPDTSDAGGPLQRQNQELSFQKRVRQALIKAGFAESRVVIGWLRWQDPPLEDALRELITAGCKRVFWLATSVPAEGLTTLSDIPARLEKLAADAAIDLQPLGPWNDDDIVADALAEKVKQAGVEANANA